MKTYVITVSRKFPTTHKRKGEPTRFLEKIDSREKKHTIRGSFELWKKRIDEVNRGEAVLSLRYWTGKPYASKQSIHREYTKDDGIGVQQLNQVTFSDDELVHNSCLITNREYDDSGAERIYSRMMLNGVYSLAQNDGLSIEDFKEWFKKAECPMAIIWFCKERY